MLFKELRTKGGQSAAVFFVNLNGKEKKEIKIVASVFQKRCNQERR